MAKKMAAPLRSTHPAAIATKQPKTTPHLAKRAKRERTGQSWGGDSWWEEILDERDEHYGPASSGAWAPVARGAAGLGSYLGARSYWRPPSSDGVWELTDSLRFAKGLAGIVAKQKLKHIGWHTQGEAISFADVGNGRITLEPKAVLKAKDKLITLDEAKTIVGGIAIHEAAHLAHTPPDHREIYERQMEQSDPSLGNWARESALALVEDAFVESAALAAYPGFVGYLEECWKDVYAPEVVEQTLLAAVDGPEEERLGKLFEVIQDRSRRYDAPGPVYDAAFVRLPADRAKLVAATGAILGRAHDATLTPADRRALATDLARLLHDGKIAPADQPDLGKQAWRPNSELREQLAKAIHDLGKKGLLDLLKRGGASEGGLEEAVAVAVAAALDRELQVEDVEIVTNTGNARVQVSFIDLDARPHESRTIQRDVAALVPPLAAKLRFRGVTPDRRTGAQLRGHLEGARLVEFPLAQAVGRQPRAFMRRQTIEAPKVGIELLVDMSGSMSNRDKQHGPRRIDVARETAMVFDGALRGLRRATHGGVEYMIHGHSTHEKGVETDCVVYRILDDRHPGIDRIGRIHASGGNYDGEALAAVAQLAARRWHDRERLILFINDGLPNGEEYGGSPAHLAIRDHCNHLRAHGTQVLTIYLGEDDDVPHDELATMYGPLGYGYIVVPQLAELPHVLGRVLTKVLKWQA